MPSWNIHTAHVERLLATEDPTSLGIRDVNAFLMGNVLPDVYVGYMVPNITKKIEYRITHFANPDFVPAPRYGDFWREYGWPSNVNGVVSDVVLGAWTHLMADYVYNSHTNAFLVIHGIQPGERTRVRKQRDFELYGRTLDISLVPQVTPELLAQCASFPQYSVEEPDVVGAAKVASRIVEKNRVDHIDTVPAYSMLNDGFFRSTADDAHQLMVSCLRAYALGEFRR